MATSSKATNGKKTAPVKSAEKTTASAKKAAVPAKAPPSKAVASKAAAPVKQKPKAPPPVKQAPKPPVQSKPAIAPKAVGAQKPPPPKPTAAQKPIVSSKPKPLPAKAPIPMKPIGPGEVAAPTEGGAPKPAAPKLTVRTPVGADELKQKIGALATATNQIKALKRTLNKSFYEIGGILRDIDTRRLYEVKGYGSFEAFLEREIDLGKQLGLRLARTVQIFQKEAALAAGLDRVSAAVAVFDGDAEPGSSGPGSSPTSPGGIRSPIPFHKL